MRGFSLIEAMIVVAILGVVAAVAVPYLLPEIHKAQLNGDTEAAANFIARARAEAMYSKRCTHVIIKGGGTSGVTLLAESLNSFDCDVTPPATPTTQIVGSPAPLFSQFDFLNSSSANVVFSFASADGGSFGLSGTAPKELRFRPNGRIWFNGALTANPGNMNTDGAVLVVKHNLIINNAELGGGAAGLRKIVVQGNGLVCSIDRGAPVSGPPFLCPIN